MSLKYGEKILNTDGNFVEPGLPAMLDFKMLKGTSQGLHEPGVVLLSASTANKFFGKDDPINKLMTVDNKMNVKVIGVYEDLPQNSEFAAVQFFLPWAYMLSLNQGLPQDDWNGNMFQTYVQLADNASLEKVSAKIRNLKFNHVNKTEQAQVKPALFLYPMDKWHLYAEFKNGVSTGGRIAYVWLFGLIGVFVLLLACINFMNLATARSVKRAKEIGVRKALGSLRSQLFKQFFSESVLVTFLAFVLAIFMVLLALPFFNEVAGKSMYLPWTNLFFWMIALGCVIITGFIAGSYPAFYLSSFEPVKVLKGTFRAGRFSAMPRKVMVVLQFTVSIMLIIGVVVVFQQIQFAKNRSVGYNRNGLIMVSNRTNDISTHFDAVKNELKETGAIVEMAESHSPTTDVWLSLDGFDWQGKDPSSQSSLGTILVSHDFGKTVGWQFTQGRDFSKEFLTDSAAFILNEAAVKYMGFKEPIGQLVSLKFGQATKKTFKVVGVIKDMLMESPYQAVRPSVFLLNRDRGNFETIKLNPALSSSDAVAKVATVFKKYAPSTQFDYKFVDQEYAKKFGDEERIGKLAFVFAALAIFISCLGIFGLASFTAEQRTKEIGVRKVNGASIFNLWQLLSKDFLLLVFVSFAIAAPVAYYFMHNWLANFIYHTNISWWIFAVVCLGALLITLLTVSYQGLRAALINPVKSLKSE
jgi:ABC-type antimicrobial peptide transport system permease subunit